MQEYTFIEAFLLGLCYMWCWCEMNFFPIPHIGDPGWLGVVFGLCYGDVKTGCIIGATIGLMYISNFAYGAAVPSDTSMAGVIAIPMALKFGLTAGEAVAVAVPFGILGALVNNIRRAFAGTYWRQSQKAIENRKYKMLKVYATFEPLLVNFLIRCLPVTILLAVFGTAGGNAIANMPSWLSRAFGMMGTMLPGVGLVLCISIMGNRSLLPYAVIGFFMVGRFGFKMFEVALLAIFLGLLHTLFTAEDEDEEEDDEEIEERAEVKGQFSTFSMIVFYWFWSMFYRSSQCMEYFYGTGNACYMQPWVKKIYKNDPDGLQKCMRRCLEPWITHPAWGFWMLSAQLAMEEDIALNGDPSGLKGQAISAMKTGFMGPFAGIGDTITGSIRLPIVRSFCYATLLTGSPSGLIIMYLNNLLGFAEGAISAIIGYKAGINSILKIIGTPTFARLLTIAIVVGMTTMGGLSASYVRINPTLEYKNEETGVDVKLADKLDAIMPNLLTFAYMCMLVAMQFKNVKTTTMMWVTVVIALAGALLKLW